MTSAADFRGHTCTNTTHPSVTDPDVKLTRMSHETADNRGHLGSALTATRFGQIVATDACAPGSDAQ